MGYIDQLYRPRRERLSRSRNEVRLPPVGMAPNYQHLRAFHAIATDGGVSRAARRLNVSQPTLSQQLKALEERHGISLFESRRVPLTLTASGRELFALTSKLFTLVSDIGELLSTRTGLDAGMLRLGADSPFYAAKLVSLLHQRYPHTQVEVRMGNAQEVMRWLADAHIDVALASEPPARDGLTYEPLGREQLMCAVPVGHSLASLERVPLDVFRTHTLLLREPTSKTRTFVERALADADVEPCGVIELQSRETIREGVALGMGIGFFYDKECPPDARLVYRPIDTADRDYRLSTYLVCQSGRRRDPLMRALQAIVTEMRNAQAPAAQPAVSVVSPRVAGAVLDAADVRATTSREQAPEGEPAAA